MVANRVQGITVSVILGLGLGVIGLLAVAHGPAQATDTDHSVTFGALERIALTEDLTSADKPAFSMESQDDSGLTLSFELGALDAQSVVIGGDIYHALEIEGGGVIGPVGTPMLPTFTRLIAIPDNAGMVIDGVEIETIELEGYLPFPMQEDGDNAFALNLAAYSAGLGTEHAWVRLGEPAIARGMRVIPVTIQPVRYRADDQILEVASRLTVRIRQEGVDLRNANPLAHASIPTSFDELYDDLVLNYEGPRDDQQVLLGNYLIVAPSNPSVVDALQPLIEWRTRRGYNVYLATTAETGTTRSSIRDWIQAQYDNEATRPEFITLVGDVDGDIELPTWFEDYSQYHGEGDIPYVHLEGDDVLADAHIGRISVRTIEELEIYVNKIVSYESTPYVDETDWYTRACLVGDPVDSGPTCIQIMQWLKLELFEAGYTEVDTVFTAPFRMQMTSKLSRGDTVFCYRGFFGTSGFANSDIYGLSNGWMMPFAVNITCQTGTFSNTTCLSEAWIRSGDSPTEPNGAVASIGTATGGTHTRYNNCVTYGIWQAPLHEGEFRFGPCLTRGRYELYLNYAAEDMINVQIFSHWNNLMGDPAGELWTAVPQALTVGHPAQLALGSNALLVEVLAEGQPCEGAYVCAWKDGEVHVGATVGSDGWAELPVAGAGAGAMKITVTKHDCIPYLGELAVGQADLFVGYESHLLDDDTGGTSSGNGDGLLNPTETIELPVELTNHGQSSAESVTAILTCDDPLVSISDPIETFGAIGSGASAWSADDFDLQVAGAAQHGHIVRLGLDVSSGGDQWHSMITIPVVAAAFAQNGTTLYDFGTRLDPGETGEISIEIENIGGAIGEDVVGTLVSDSDWVAVTDDGGAFGTVPVAGSAENTADRFALSVSPECHNGHIAEMTLNLSFSGGAEASLPFALSVGQVSSSDPTGPDAYGYYAFDNTDTGYPHAPVFDWIELNPAYGGDGVSVGLNDFGEDQDESLTVELPFPVTYYGQTFNQATICSNGWIAMGSTYLVNYRNWTIPGAGAPDFLIAPMWDNLYQEDERQVYHRYDETNHRYIVQWSRLRNMEGDTTQDFEVIFYDTSFYSTETGDAMITFQYDTFNNSDDLQQYSTIGIQNGDRSDGLMYGYYNYYNAGAATIQSGRAIKFVALSSLPRGMISGTVTTTSAGGAGIPGAQVSLLDGGPTLTCGAGGAYGGSVPIGTYLAIASHPSFLPDTVSNVTITEGQATVVDFELEDILGPVYTGTTDIGSTTDPVGPYEIFTTATDFSGIATLDLYYNVGSGWMPVPMVDQGDNLWRAEIPGQPAGTLVGYYLVGEDNVGNSSSDPSGAPGDYYSFWVIDAVIDDDMEAGGGDWIHYNVSGGYEDEWHMTGDRNHTPDGSWCWKHGSTGGGDYGNNTDGALESVAFDVDGEGTLTFWHWVDTEFWSQGGDAVAFDGGIIELSIDEGAWFQVDPVGGYYYELSNWGGGSPFDEGIWIFGGYQEWTEVEVDLSGIEGSVRVRFRFGSGNDNWGNEAQGWFIDDVLVMTGGGGFSDATELELMPTTVTLHQNAPNPFGQREVGTLIRFDLPRASEVRLRILDTSGRAVRGLLNAGLPAGYHQVRWDGRDANGQPVPNGVYFYSLETGDQHQARQLLRVR